MAIGSSDVVAIVALIISLAAFFTTILQVLQQYLASAEGFRRCAPSVMGLWHGGTKRKFRRRELRFEVVFETPVLFLAPPNNTRGPIEGRPIYNVDGTDTSYEETNTMKPGKEKITNVSTADDEQASWVLLLSVLQLEERESRAWEEQHRVSPRRTNAKSDKPIYTIVTMVQKKTRSYDFMPDSVTKPFATTTISHLVEMVALMGMYWKAFDELKGNVRAEGNGLILTSTQVHTLGLMATFSKTGMSKFEKNRVIPSHDIKEYVFGFVPSILGLLEVLPNDIERTLSTLKCTWETIQAFKGKNDRGNIPSVTFEIIAILAKPVRIKGSHFKMLPNPTADRWPGKSSVVNWLIAMEAFQMQLSDMLAHPGVTTPHTGPYLGATIAQHPLTTTIQNEWDKILIFWKKSADSSDAEAAMPDFDIDMREALHHALDETGAALLNPAIVSRLDVIAVLGSHIQQVLLAYDAIADDVAEVTSLPAYLSFSPSLSRSHSRSPSPSFPLNMPHPTNQSHPALQTHPSHVSQGSLSAPAPPPSTSASQSNCPSKRFIAAYFREILPTVTDALIDGDVPSEDVKNTRRAIWCTFVFRMCAWFLLHEFGEGDVNMMRGDMKGSRMPVFIG